MCFCSCDCSNRIKEKNEMIILGVLGGITLLSFFGFLFYIAFGNF